MTGESIGEHPPIELREPAHQVSPRAINYWRVWPAIWLAIWLIAVIVYAVVPIPERPWWGWLIAAVLILGDLVELVVMPKFRYRIHRWEVTPIAIHTQTGWLSIENRIAPLSRVQTVDSRQGALMRPFKLASITVTTASASGPITIDCLDEDVAKRLVAELTEITGASEGDAT